jgi:ferredoxin
MKMLILYYSGTGNTRFACTVAETVMKKEGHEVVMKRLDQAADVNIDDFDAYCFGAPVYEWAPAKNVELFVSSMKRLDGKCTFILTSSAGAKGEATELFARMLEDRGITVLGDHNLICPDSWGGTRRWSYWHDTKTPTRDSVRELADFVLEMLEMAKRFVAGETIDVPDYRVRKTGLFFASRLSRLAPSARLKMGKKKVDSEACNECGVCAKLCPMQAITLDPQPVFSSRCIGCWRCVNMCPKDCITTLLDSGRHYKGITDKDELLRGI